jgi:short subunit dehydrogenase-like uncharacterized protein
MHDIWILGASGRTGQAIAKALAAQDAPLVLVGRDAGRLRQLAERIGAAAQIVEAGSLEAICAALSQAGGPVVVVNTIGPFAVSALPLVQACGAGSHYLDLSNELLSIRAVLDLQDSAVAADKCLVTGAGFGVLACESIVLKLCEGRGPAARVRVDAFPFVFSDSPAPLGPTLAATLTDTRPRSGRRYAKGQLTRCRLGSAYQTMVLPDGRKLGSGAMPTGDLEAARRASGAKEVIAGSSFVPASPLIRALLPILMGLLAIGWVREWVKRRPATLVVPASDESQRHLRSYSHASVEWADGTIRTGWLRTGEAMAFTPTVAAEVAWRLANDGGRPGAFTPGALFGPDLALAAGGTFLPDGN